MSKWRFQEVVELAAVDVIRVILIHSRLRALGEADVRAAIRFEAVQVVCVRASTGKAIMLVFRSTEEVVFF